MSYRASFNRTFSAAHRVWTDVGKCHNIHGHNYEATVEVVGVLLDESGFVIPFDHVKMIIDGFDHTMIVADSDPLLDIFQALGLALSIVPCVPSTENLAALIANNLVDAHPGLMVKVWLRETAGILAIAEAS